VGCMPLISLAQRRQGWLFGGHYRAGPMQRSAGCRRARICRSAARLVRLSPRASSPPRPRSPSLTSATCLCAARGRSAAGRISSIACRAGRSGAAAGSSGPSARTSVSKASSSRRSARAIRWVARRDPVYADVRQHAPMHARSWRTTLLIRTPWVARDERAS
jgi:hypothetical protein